MDREYKKTVFSCFTGYIVQAIVNNFIPLLFLTFNRIYNIPLSQITLLVTINFGVQLSVDLLSVSFVDRIGYRASMIIAHAAAALGLIGLAFIPDMMSNHFAGILVCVVLYAIGGGLLEVLVSPIMEACPTDNKEAAMSLLHSFYCFGHVGVVLLSTLFFTIAGIDNWRYMALIWAIIPIFNLIMFTKVPIAGLIEEGQRGMSIKELFRSKVFWIFILLMVCSGSCEQAVSQWASTLAEHGLKVSKTVGDLAGPMFFAIMMGTSRAIYGKIGDRLPLRRSMFVCGLMCLASYLIITLSPWPILSLVGCGICGFSVGLLWPGTFSMASAAMPMGGTAMFAFLALAGDVGCMSGPTYVGFISGLFGNNLMRGILCAVIFPVLLLIGLTLVKKKKEIL